MTDLRNPVPITFADWFEEIEVVGGEKEEDRAFLRAAAAIWGNPVMRRVVGIMEARCLKGITECPLTAPEQAEALRMLLHAVGNLRAAFVGFGEAAEKMRER